MGGQSNDYLSIMYQDIKLATFNRRNGQAAIDREDLFPFDLYLTESDDFDDRLNNVTNFNSWCASRVLPLDRKYAKEILNFYGYKQAITDKDRADIALFCSCVSLQDCFWVKPADDTRDWSSTNLFQNSLSDTVLEVALLGKSLTMTNTEIVTPDFSTDGTAPKAWIRREHDFFLYKGDVNDSVTREVEASRILQEIGIPAVQYREKIFMENRVAVCKCFTSEEVNLVRAGDYALWCDNHDLDFAEILCKYSREFELMNLGDFLVGNNDRHSQNWGFVYDSTRTMTGFAPVIDFDHAFLAGEDTRCLPMLLVGEEISQKDYALRIISKYRSELNFDMDYRKYKYGRWVKDRVDTLLNQR